MPDVVRWGLVGLGLLAKDNIAPAIAASPGSTLVACAGRTPEQGQAFAREFAVPHPHPSYVELVTDPEVDVVFVAAPNGLHRDITIAAARAAKHVLCEKPFALSVADGQAMVAACNAAGVMLRVGFQIRQEPVLRRVREVVRAGAIGELRALSFERTSLTGPKAPWRHDIATGGVLFDVAVHLLDLAQWITGLRYREIAAFSHPDRRDGLAEDTVTVLGTLGSACQAVFRASREVPFARNDLVIEGTKGMISTSALRWVDEFSMTVTTADGSKTETFAPCGAYDRQIEAFERELAEGTTTLPTGADGIYMIEVATAVFEAIRTRRAISLAGD